MEKAEHKHNGNSDDSSSENGQTADETALVTGSRKTAFQKRKNNLITFFTELPKMKSHYCRAKTQKLYLEPIWNSVTHLFNAYRSNWCSKKNIKPVSQTLFIYTFEDMNLGIF